MKSPLGDAKSEENTSGIIEDDPIEVSSEEETEIDEGNEEIDRRRSPIVRRRLLFDDESFAQSDEFQQHIFSRQFLDKDSSNRGSTGGLLGDGQSISDEVEFNGELSDALLYGCPPIKLSRCPTIRGDRSDSCKRTVGSYLNETFSSSREGASFDIFRTPESKRPIGICVSPVKLSRLRSRLVECGSGRRDDLRCPVSSYTFSDKSEASDYIQLSKEIGLSSNTSQYQSNQDQITGGTSMEVSCKSPNNENCKSFGTYSGQGLFFGNTMCSIADRCLLNCWCGVQNCIGHFSNPSCKSRCENGIQEIRDFVISFYLRSILKNCVVVWSKWDRKDRMGDSPVRACIISTPYGRSEVVFLQPTSWNCIRRFCIGTLGYQHDHPFIRSIEACDNQCQAWVCPNSRGNTQDLYLQQEYSKYLECFESVTRT